MLNKEAFFDKYNIHDAFGHSDLDWDMLVQIYEDYENQDKIFEQCLNHLIKYTSEGIDFPIHSIHGRKKDAEHLIEKIIRKRGVEQSFKYKGICVDNYREIVRDLVGIRILILSKEEWELTHRWLLGKFQNAEDSSKYMAELPQAYTRYGDRDIFGDKIHKEHSNKGYRSQHYIVKFDGIYCELQVRTLSEEVFGEFDHRVKYPYREQNKFLVRYTNMVSQFLDSVDEMISTCFQMEEQGWNHCSQYYQEDVYIDWKKMDRKETFPKKSVIVPQKEQEKIELNSYANQFILRKGR